MSTRNLDKVFHPASVALIGASTRPQTVSAAVAHNLLAGGFGGRLYLVNRKGGTLGPQRLVKRVADLPEAPDLAVIATPPDTVAPLIAELGARGTKAAVILTAGFGEGGREEGLQRRAAMLEAARPHLLRIVGPNCVGFLAPRLHLNASFAPTTPGPGRIAAVAQSGAILTALIDWAAGRGVGFSYLVSVGDMADVDFGDVLDYLALDGETRAVLLYIEAVTHARKFMSAARALARMKPVIVLKGGRHGEGARAAASHTGAMAGADAVYDAAFRRAGLLRVSGLGELFDAAETLGLAKPLAGDGLAILTNGGGIGVVTTDDLVARGGRLAALSPATIGRLDGVLPAQWSRANPVDIIGDADAARFAAAIDPLAEDRDTGAVLVMYAPTALASPLEAANAVAAGAARHKVPFLTCWVGGATTAAARRIFIEASIPTYESPERAVDAFLHLVRYRRSQATLMQSPPSLPEERPDIESARAIIATALGEGRSLLTEPEAKRLLAAYRIPIVPTEVAPDAERAVRLARAIGFPVVLKLLSRDITHKSDVGGVALGLETPEAVALAAAGIKQRLADAQPEARFDGFTVQKMIRRPGAHELILGAVEDPIFGPVVMFGHGGTGAEQIDDKALALPPLNLALAENAMTATRIDRLLHGYRDRPPADRAAVALALVRVSQLIADLDEVAELDINPLVADADGVVALDARVVIRPAAGGERARRFAIRPYPSELVAEIAHRGGRYLIRPIRPEDESALRQSFNRMSPDDVRMRFFAPLRVLSHEMAARLTQIDYDREMALVLFERSANGPDEPVGVVRLAADPDLESAEFAIVVLSGRQGKGFGHLLMERIIAYARQRRIKRIVGHVLTENSRMLDLARSLGFDAVHTGEPGVLRVVKTL